MLQWYCDILIYRGIVSYWIVSVRVTVPRSWNVPYYYHYLCAFVDGTALFDLFFFYMMFLLGGLFKRTFHVEKNAERDKLAVTMGKKTGGRFKDDWDWLKMKGGNEQKRPTWIISVDVSMAVSWLINCGYYNYLLIGMIFQVPRKGERHVSRYSLYDVRNISQFWRKNVNR